MKWELGRQGTGYYKLALGSGRSWDCWLLKYPPGSHIPAHTDPVPHGRHYRINLVVWGPQSYRGKVLFKLGPLVFFRPDVMEHSVVAGKSFRYVLSFGWVK